MINFTFSALPGRVFGSRIAAVPEGNYQAGFKPLRYGMLAALVLTLLLKETGSAAKKS
jgi:hypothetical protein